MLLFILVKSLSALQYQADVYSEQGNAGWSVTLLKTLAISIFVYLE